MLTLQGYFISTTIRKNICYEKAKIAFCVAICYDCMKIGTFSPKIFQGFKAVRLSEKVFQRLFLTESHKYSELHIYISFMIY